MSLDSDIAVDRRRLKRRLSLWRALAVVVAAAAIATVVGQSAGLVRGAHVARIAVKGVIVENHERDEAIDLLGRNKAAKALIVHIDSQGGTVVGGERLYRSLRRLSEKKPVVAVMGTTATSAGYMTAIGADRIVASPGSITGSIGVILQATDVTGFLEKLGVATEAVKSGALKGVPSPLEKLTEAGRRATKTVVDDVQAMFIDLVKERRNLDPDAVREVGDGRIFTGRQALDKGLVDELGGEREARAWLKAERGIDDKLPVVDLDLDDDGRKLTGWWRFLGSWLPGGKTLFSERLTLDGLISVWHPQ